MREGSAEEFTTLVGLLSRLELRGFDVVIAEVATSRAATYRLRAADAVHLATALVAGADRFAINNRRDFPDTLAEINVTFPDAARPSAGLIVLAEQSASADERVPQSCPGGSRFCVLDADCTKRGVNYCSLHPERRKRSVLFCR